MLNLRPVSNQQRVMSLEALVAVTEMDDEENEEEKLLCCSINNKSVDIY